MDEIREELAGAFRGYRPDDWRPAPYRPIVSMPADPTAEDFAERINAVDPTDLPDDIPESVRCAVALRLRESQGREGMDSLTQQQRPDTNNHHPSEPESNASIQRSLWNGEETPPVEAAATEIQNGAEEREASQAETVSRPYTMDDFQEFLKLRRRGQLTAEEWKSHFRWLVESKEPFIEKLLLNSNAAGLKALAAQCGVYDARRNTKPQNAEAIYRALLRSYTPGDTFSYQPMSETMEEAATRHVEAITDETIAEETRKRSEEAAKKEKAVTDPENLTEFYHFIQTKGTDALSDEQFALWDRLHAQMSRQRRQDARQSQTVEQFHAAELAGVAFRIIEGYHEKKQTPLHIVQLTSRVERSAFNELKDKARQLGGWWSSFKKDSAGFQFVSREAAEKFVGLAQGDADSSEEQLAKKLHKMDSAAARLNAVADTLESNANEVLAADETRLKNTDRRARMAAGQRADARSDLATAATLRSVASTLAGGEATFLDRVWNSRQIQTLKTILWKARRARIRQSLESEGRDRREDASSLRYDELEERPYEQADVRYAVYPKPYLSKRRLVEAVERLQNTRGVKQNAAKMRKRLNRIPEGQDYVEFNSERDIGLLEEFLSRAKASGYDCYWFNHCLDDYKRLQSANLYDAHELRTALRELVPHLRRAAGDDPVKQAEDELRGKKLDGFFPTPRPVIERMLDLADLQVDDRALEPSCGKGDILDAIRRRRPDVKLKGIEQNRTLQGVLSAKGYDELVEYGDFLEHVGQYDTIVMNPPFERGQDIDHVRYAFDLLAPGGRLVAVMCEGPFFRSDAKSEGFRKWLDDQKGHSEPLPEDAFGGVDAFRQTGVRARLVILDKGGA